jgi:hypothetical protein
MTEDEDIIEEVAGEQGKNSREERIARLQPHQYKKGQSGNPSGRPKGISLKEYAKLKLIHMTEEEREEFFNGLPKDKIWEMAEGKAEAKTDLYIKELPQPILDVIPKDNSNSENNVADQEN